MTIAKSFLCPYCKGTNFHLKFQADDSIHWRPWSFSVTCENCYGVINGSFGPGDKFSPDLPVADKFADGFVFAYSNTLPITTNIYYQPWNGYGIGSPYMNILNLSPAINSITVSLYGRIMRNIEEGIVRYKDALSDLYPVLRKDKTKVGAFQTIMCNIFEINPQDVTQNLNSWEVCYNAFNDLHKVVRDALSNLDNSVSPFFIPAIEKLVKIGSGSIKNIFKYCFQDKAEFDRYNDLINQGLNTSLKDLPKLLPAFFIDLLDQNRLSIDCELKLVTASIIEIENLYKDNFNLLAKFLPLIMALYNTVHNNNPNRFIDSEGKEQNFMITDLIAKSDGTRISIMSQIPVLREVLKEAYNNHVRNGIDHNDKDYNIKTQLAIYYYDKSDISKNENCYLIRLSHMCIMQLRCLTWLRYLMLIIEQALQHD